MGKRTWFYRASVACDVLGISGLPDDIDTWREWLMFLNRGPISWAFIIIGTLGIIYFERNRLANLALSFGSYFPGRRKRQRFQSIYPELSEMVDLIENMEHENVEETNKLARRLLSRLYQDFDITPYPLEVSNVDPPDEPNRLRRDFFRHMARMSQKGDLRSARRYSKSL